MDASVTAGTTNRNDATMKKIPPPMTTALNAISSDLFLSPSLIGSVFVIWTCFKILLFPAYRSTDFQVHRHWKALTRHLPLEEWYFDDRHVATVHTLDYPPGFALWEASWSRMPWLVEWLQAHHWVDASCWALIPSPQDQTPSAACVAYMRSTVLLSDVLFWMGSYAVAKSAAKEKTTAAAVAVFWLLVLHPGFLWLDAIHFQYNGFLCGILLLSWAALLQGRRALLDSWQFHAWHLGGAMLYALLLTFKHLYLILSLWYFAYLLRRYCCVTSTTTASSSATGTRRLTLSLSRLCVLGSVTVLTLVLPFVPFVLSTPHPTDQLIQMFQRLFPFGRGLVHDYWAGNLWAWYVAAQKVLPSLPEPSPGHVALVLLLTLIPGAVAAWYAGGEEEPGGYVQQQQESSVTARTTTLTSSSSPSRFWSSLAYTTLASFLTAYHVHEKAIITTLLPLTIWIASRSSHNTMDNLPDSHARLLFRTQAVGLMGLLPLLFRPTETLVKLTTLVGYLAAIYGVLELNKTACNETTKRVGHSLSWWWNVLRSWILLKDPRSVVVLVAGVVMVLEVLTPLQFWGRYEFLPLALTSLTTAVGLFYTYAELVVELIWPSPNLQQHE